MHVILDPELRSKINRPIPVGTSILCFKIMSREKNSPGPEASVQLSPGLYYITRAIPVCLNTHTWHVGVHNHIIYKYFGIVQPVLHYLSVSMIVALSKRLHPLRTYLLLGSRSPQHQILSTFVNLTPRCSKSKLVKVKSNISLTRCEGDCHDSR